MYGNTADCPCFKTIITLYNIRTSYLQIQNTEYMYSILAVLNITVIHNQVNITAGGIQACTKYAYFGLTKYGVLVVRIYCISYVYRVQVQFIRIMYSCIRISTHY